MPAPALLLLALPLSVAQAAVTITVDPAATGADPRVVPTLAAADALLADGDTLHLVAGTHRGCLRLEGRSLTITGAGPDATTWQGEGCSEQLRARDGETLTLSDLALTNPGNRVVAVLGGVLTARDLRIFGSGDDAIDGAGIWARASDTVIERVVFADNRARLGAGFYPWDGGTAWVSEATFTGNHATEQGGALYANGGVDGTIAGSTFSDNRSDAVSGAMGWHLGQLVLTDTVFSGNVAATNGGALYAHHSTARVVIQDVVFADNVATEGRGGALYGAYGTDFAMSGIVLRGNAAVEGADFALIDGRLTLVDAVSTGARATAGAHLWLGPGVPVALRRVAVCDAVAPGGGALAHSAGTLDARSVLGHSLSGTALQLTDGTAALAFLGLSALDGTALDARALEDGAASLQNSVLVDVAGEAITGAPSLGWNDRWELARPGAAPADTSLAVDPRWAGGDCGLGFALPAPDSALIDTADPALVDPDGTRADIGPWGGPDSPMADRDGDGAWTVQDCDDDDPARAPGREELPDDGIDQDCDGEDAAGDTTAADTADPTPTPAHDSGSAAIDADDAPAPVAETQGRGCAVAGPARGAGGLGALLLLLVAVLAPRYARSGPGGPLR